MAKVNIAPGLEYLRADEIAECFELRLLDDKDRGALVTKLWRISSEAENPTPMGGDGSDDTCETPDGQLFLGNDDKAGVFWDKLEDFEQEAINDSYGGW